MAAGTLLQEFFTLHAPCALACSHCCRADASGEVSHTVHSPRLSPLARSDTRHTQDLDDQTHEATEACSTTAPDPCPRVPVGDKRPFPVLPLSAPNRLKRDSCCSARPPLALPQCRSGGRTIHLPKPPGGLEVSPTSAKPSCPRTTVPCVKVSMAYSNGLGRDPPSLAAHTTS